MEDIKFNSTEEDELFINMNEFSDILIAATYIIDFKKRCFCFVSNHDFFLCGFSSGDALRQGYDFYSKIVYPEDLSLWTDMRKAVLRHIRDFEEKRNEIDYFSCTFRLQHKYFFLTHPLLQMVFHRMKPIWKNGELRYLICSVKNSTDKEAGNLCMHYKDGSIYEEYNFRTGRWKRNPQKPLTERERAILILALQGKSTKEIANDLCKGQNTIQNQIKLLFSKLKVHTMQEAIEFACHHRLIYLKQDVEPQAIEAPCKRKRVLITETMMLHIQQHLSVGDSIRQTASLEGTSEGAIRYWITQGKLKIVK
jgi:DNA-binding CsgD family transcriptional regulator